MEVFKTHGAFSWNELMTSDPAAAAAFYGALFGWKIKDPDEAMGGYRVISVGEAGVGGIMASPKDAPPMPPHWGCYVTVENMDTTLATCESLGGKCIVPPMDVPGVGRMAVILDPQGAALSVIQYAMA